MFYFSIKPLSKMRDLLNVRLVPHTYHRSLSESTILPVNSKRITYIRRGKSEIRPPTENLMFDYWQARNFIVSEKFR